MPGHPAEPENPEKVRAYLCPLCKLILRDAVQTDSGVRLCSTCYAESPAETSVKYNKDRAVRKEVLKIQVKCKYHKLSDPGCPWTGKLQDWEQHCLQCSYKFVECPNGCGTELPPSELDAHVDVCPYREVGCVYCEKSLQSRHLDQHHRACERYPLECERCHETVERSKVEDHHLHECPKELCLLCDTMVDRETTEELQPESPTESGKQAQKSKSRRKKHLHLAHPKATHQHVQTLASEQQVIQRYLKALQAKVDDEMRQAASTGALQSAMNECKSAQTELVHRLLSLEHLSAEWKTARDDERNVHDKRVAMEAELEQKIRELSRRVTDQSETISRQKEQISSLQLAYESVRQSHEGQVWQQKISEKQQGYEEGDRYLSSMAMSRESSVTLEKKVEGLEKQMSSMKMHVSDLELQLQASMASTHDGAFLWRIPGVSSRRRDAINERITSIYSPPFYTGRCGYKMCVRAYLNGDGAGYKTHLSIFFVLMKGEYDPLLKWPFEHKVSLILIDQCHHRHMVQTFRPSHESTSFKRPEADMNVASGCPKFAKLSVLDDPSYVKDDVMYVKCIVDTSKIFHP